MPYIRPKERPKYKTPLDKVPIPSSKGDLEYCIFYLMKRYMSTRKKKYSEYHDVVYASQHCSDEYRRRYLDKREDKARKTNGDV